MAGLQASRLANQDVIRLQVGVDDVEPQLQPEGIPTALSLLKEICTMGPFFYRRFVASL